MRRLKGHIPLTRRLLGQYLMFALASVATLGAGLLLVVHSAHGRSHEDSVLDLLDAAAEAIIQEPEGPASRRVQHCVDRAAIEGELHYCAVASPEGTFLCHSSRELIGRPCPGAAAAHSASVVERTRLDEERGSHLVEYVKPLRRQGKLIGTLHCGLVPSRSGDWIRRLLDSSPPAMLAPFLLLFVGGKVIVGSLRTNAAVEERLAQAAWMPPESASSLLPVEEDGPVAAGWNRLTQQLQKARPASSLGRQLEAALGGIREKRAEQAIHAIPEGVALTDHEGRVLLANHALCALVGTEEASVSGAVLTYLVPWRDDPDGDAKSRKFDDTARPAAVELRRGACTADGVLRIARTPLPSEHGGVSSHVWLIRDVTQQKLAEESREQFVYSATHELRTPLANIKAYAETLTLHDFDDVEQRRNFLNTINIEASRLARFVDDLLNISRMEAGSLNLAFTRTDLRRLLAEVVEKVRPQIEQNEQFFEVVLPAKLPELALDKENLTAALVNVLGNAAKYTPRQGKVSLRVEQDDASVQIHVEDTGFGISKEELPKLCSKFFRSSDPRVQEATGTGLGLAFTNEVVRLHGGRMQIHSELNKGSRFTIVLPGGSRV